ncbi:MAG: amidohydrolase family protein [Actinomycetia bacterium]|nr:amidohydrolase family protein [Actinomycetes bacterium]
MDPIEVVDIHTHVVPVDVMSAPGRGLPSVVPGADPDHAELLTAGGRRRVLPATAWDLGLRLRDMDEQGVTRQVLSPLPDLFAYDAETAPATDWCRAVNDWTAAAVRGRPGRFDGLAILPLQDPEAAAHVLDEVADGPLCGVLLGSSVAGTPLTDQRYEEIFRLAAALDLCVLVHAVPGPHFAAVAGRTQNRALAAAASLPGEISSVGLGLLAAGQAGRPGPRIALSHCGGGMPLLTGRLAAAQGEPADPQRFWYDSVAFDHSLVDAVAERVGPRRVLAGSDYPSALPAWPPHVGAASAENAAAFLGPRSQLHQQLHAAPSPRSA